MFIWGAADQLSNVVCLKKLKVQLYIYYDKLTVIKSTQDEAGATKDNSKNVKIYQIW